MRIGALRQRLTLQYETTVGSTNPGWFEGKKEWVDWKTDIACAVSVRRGGERFMQSGEGGEGQRYSHDVYFFTVRQPSVRGVHAAMRVVHGGQVFDIKHIRTDPAYKREVTLECELQDGVLDNPPLVPAILENIPAGTVGQPYSGFSVSAEGAATPYSFIADALALPSGLVIDESSGAISGTPTDAGEHACEVIVTAADGSSARISFTITIGV